MIADKVQQLFAKHKLEATVLVTVLVVGAVRLYAGGSGSWMPLDDALALVAEPGDPPRKRPVLGRRHTTAL